MSVIQRQVSAAHWRLTCNLMLSRLALGIVAAAGMWALAIVVDRGLGLGLPLLITAPVAGAIALIVTIVGVVLGRSKPLAAAVEIDRAAGLKERVSTAFTIGASADPFAQAARRDAEKVAASIHVPTHVPIRAPELWPWSIATTVAALCVFALMPNLNLLASDTHEKAIDPTKLGQTKQEKQIVETQVNEQVSKLKKMIEDNPALGDLAKDIKPLDIPDKPDIKPEDVRREAIKKLDNLAEQLAEKRQDDALKLAEELKKQLAEIKPQEGRDPASQLMKDLASGDMKSAQNSLADIKKELEQAAEKKNDPATQQKMQEMSKKLEDLSKQLNDIAKDDQKMQKELENKAGMTPEQAAKLLEQAAKMDPKQLEKMMQQALGEKGMDQKQIQELAQKLAQNQQVKEAAKKLAEKMEQAAKACQNPGQQGNKGQQGQQGQGQQGQDQQQSPEGSESLDSAAQQLSEMEMAEQLGNELDAQMSDLQQMREGMCQNPGNKPSDKPSDQIGNQGPQYGQGYGGGIGKQTGAHKYKASRLQGKMQGGEIIGQKLIDGPQIKGEATAETKEAISSALRDATDAIERDQVPRMYEKVVKNYFLTLAGLAGVEQPTAPSTGTGTDPAKAAGDSGASTGESKGDAKAEPSGSAGEKKP